MPRAGSEHQTWIVLRKYNNQSNFFLAHCSNSFFLKLAAVNNSYYSIHLTFPSPYFTHNITEWDKSADYWTTTTVPNYIFNFIQAANLNDNWRRFSYLGISLLHTHRAHLSHEPKSGLHFTCFLGILGSCYCSYWNQEKCVVVKFLRPPDSVK